MVSKSASNPSERTERRIQALSACLRIHPGADPFGQLVGQMAHDFNNVLAVALTGAEMAQSVSDNARAQRFLGMALDAIQGGRQLTDRLAAVSQTSFSRDLIDVHAFISSLHEVLREHLGECELRLQLEAEDSVVETDATMLGVALLNLAINAAEAMPRGGRWTLATRNENREGLRAQTNLLIEATDNGTGMPEEVSQRAFELFFSTKSAERGLGLPQVRDLARRSGGTARILDGSTELGTTVRMVLPLASQDGATA